MNKKGLILPQREYFTWEEYRDNGLICEGGFTLLNGGRDIGKTTGSFIAWLNIASKDEMIFFIRNTEKEIQQYRKSFNAQFATEYYMSQSEIWKLERIELLNKKTKNIEIDYRKKELIGLVGALNGTDGWRSANFEKIKYIFSDEYNQIGNSLNFEKFMTLWTSILRTKQNVYTLMIGNRDDASSDIIVELGVDIIVPDGYEGDYVIPLLPNDENFKDKCWYIDVDDKRFMNNHKPTIWKSLGRESVKMGQYYDRGYKSYDNLDCRKLPDATLDLVHWEWSYKWGDYKIVCGKLLSNDGNELVVAHLDVKSKYKPQVKFGDTVSTFISKNTQDIYDNYAYVFWYIVNAVKESNIIYTSIAVKEQLASMIDCFAMNIKEKSFKL